MWIPLQNITEESFAPLTAKRTVNSLCMHPNARESFEPLEGIAAIIVAAKDEPIT